MRKGSHYTEEHIEQRKALGGFGKGMTGHHHTLEAKRKLYLSNIGKKQSEETRQKKGDALRGRKQSEEEKRNNSLSQIGKPHPWAKGIPKPPEVRALISASKKKWWAEISPERREEQFRLQSVNRDVRPTKPEAKLYELIQETCPEEYIYCGDFSVVIGKISPDFININGQKKVIEMFGNYWHKPGSDRQRRAILHAYGFDCLVIWEHELKDLPREEIIEKIKCFHQRTTYA